MDGSQGTWRLRYYFAASGVVLLGLLFGAQAVARGAGANATTPCVVINDSISMADNTLAGMLIRTGVPSSCNFYPTCPGTADTIPRHYKRYNYYFPYGSFSYECVTVRLTATGCPGNLYSVAYTGFESESDELNDICPGYAGDTGDVVTGTSSYSFNVFRGTRFGIVVHEVSPDTGCSSFTLELTSSAGCSGITTPIPFTSTPTKTPTNTASATRTATTSPTSKSTSTPPYAATASKTAVVVNTSTYTPTSTRTPASGVLLVGHIDWQGIPQPNHRNTTETLTLTLRLNSGGPLIQYGNMTTDAAGYLTVPVGSLAAGTYDYRAKGPRNLANGGSVTLAGAPVTNLEMGLMASGDANNDNVVNATDFAILRSTFGKPFCFCTDYDPRADFNNSDSVDVTDFTLLKGNFGHEGVPPIGL
jgi:hypothetical protein